MKTDVATFGQLDLLVIPTSSHTVTGPKFKFTPRDKRDASLHVSPVVRVHDCQRRGDESCCHAFVGEREGVLLRLRELQLHDAIVAPT